MAQAGGDAWFAGEEGDFLVYRVNRRPFTSGLFTAFEMPTGVYDHFVRVLTPGEEIVTGRRHRRTWRVGGIRLDPSQKIVTGNLGWVPRDEELVVPVWDDDADDWVMTTTAQHGGRVVPFGFDAECRLLIVLREPSTKPQRYADVLEKLLRREENQLPEPSTEWSVEPVLDKADFLDWLRRADSVRLVSFAARLPNPEPTDATRDLIERMRRRRATLYRETMRSSSPEGLVGIEDDPDFRQAIEMGRQGWATIRGEAEVNGSVVPYSQTDTVAREHIDELPPTWDEVRMLIVKLLKTRVGRFLDSESNGG